MNRSTLTLLGVSVFGLILVSFLIRGVGQLVVGARTSTLLAAPTFLLAFALAAFLVSFWLLAQVGLTRVEDGE